MVYVCAMSLLDFAANLTVGGRDAQNLLDGHDACSHLIEAVHIPHQSFENAPADALALLPANKNKAIVVYCESGNRAATVRGIITANGYTNVRHLAGDYPGWKAAGLPVAGNL